MKCKNNVFPGKLKQVFICTGIGLLLVGMIFQSIPVYGEGRVKPEWVMPRHYPFGFHGMGHIDRITQDKVVIDEHLHKLSPQVKYHTPALENAPSDDIKPGKKVGYILNSKNEITSIWLIERD